MADVECIVAGAGVVGLAVARALALSGREVLVLDAREGIGTQTSSRNSEVIHAGLYYPEGSLKARLCVAGRLALYDYLGARGLAHARCGKLIVATGEGQLPKLHAIMARAAAAGVDDLELVDHATITALEPEVAAIAAIRSPSTGIVDSHAFMLSLQGDIENSGGLLAFHAPVGAVRRENGMFVVETAGTEPATITTRTFINSAGHGAPVLAAKMAGFPRQMLPRQAYAKGNYFALTGRQPFSRLIYPVPEAAGLGVHATVDLAGRVRFGPDVEWVGDDQDLAVDPARAASFYAAIRSYWPGLADGALTPDYAGIRPKIHGECEPMPDFRIDGPLDHGVPDFVTLFGIESPGLTASLAIGDEVVARLRL